MRHLLDVFCMCLAVLCCCSFVFKSCIFLRIEIGTSILEFPFALSITRANCAAEVPQVCIVAL